MIAYIDISKLIKQVKFHKRSYSWYHEIRLLRREDLISGKLLIREKLTYALWILFRDFKNQTSYRGKLLMWYFLSAFYCNLINLHIKKTQGFQHTWFKLSQDVPHHIIHNNVIMIDFWICVIWRYNLNVGGRHSGLLPRPFSLNSHIQRLKVGNWTQMHVRL